MEQIIHLSRKGQYLCMASALLMSLLMFCLPLAVVLIIRFCYGEALQSYLQHPLLPMLFSFLPLAVLRWRLPLLKIFGKIGFCVILELSMTSLLLGFSPQFESLFAWQWLWTIPVMIAVTIAGFVFKRLLLPQIVKFFFYALVCFGVLADLAITFICGTFPGWFLCIGIAILFVFLQFSHARVLQGRLERKIFSNVELKNLTLNYALIFSINLAGMLLTVHPMKLCLAFMFDTLAAQTPPDLRHMSQR